MSKVRVYAHAKRTFLLTALDGTSMLVRPNGFYDIPEKFTGDITYRRAVKAGDLQVFETTKQGDAIERAANEAENTQAPETPSESSDSADNVEQGEKDEAAKETVATGSKDKAKDKNKSKDAKAADAE